MIGAFWKVKGDAAALAAGGFLLAACSFAPDIPPSTTEVPTPAAGEFASAASETYSAGAPSDTWWRLYDDPVLDELVTQALANNNSLKAAAANLKQVAAALGESRSSLFPSTSFSAGAEYGRDDSAQPTIEPEKEELTYTAGFTTRYELDFFGRVSNSIRAAQANARAAAAALGTVQVTVAAETARAYADICAANMQIEVTQSTLDLQGRTIDLTTKLKEGGQGTRLDVVRAEVNYENTRATMPTLMAARQSARFRLGTLLGKTPQEVTEAVADCDAMPKVKQAVPVGDGAGLIARRPDVKQAEQTLKSAAAQIGVATAGLFPQISLGGDLTSTALQIPSLGEEGALDFSIGPLISWSFPNMSLARARIASSEAGLDKALAEFDQTVLEALAETETALQNYAAELKRTAALERAEEAAATSADLARKRYELGADDFITVLDAERTLADAKIERARSQALAASYQIAVFKALGGGWDRTLLASAD